ncbi:tripartite tricarboxylate transporter substrate binding protein [Variovorax sp. YR216]|uniref:Bug family tripartite tricarboxylate transporter substrate binding protein n=1 Tax=Variovorax sp. YR216 TaxID=1882828 RepID=UPI00089CC43C|nr:tripartite tricarboxylate transporter substrate binding protein [Variovorax sp. YR216]SEB24718.1 Tripartite-type tricarboxylate transporter, receptor component TctC [Variovorax sp. YR216]
MNRIAKACAALWLGVAAGLASAFPDKPVHLVLPYPAGGPTDAVARTVAERLSATWGQPVIVDNRPGANGAIGTELVAKSPADGYTLLVHSPIMLATEMTRPTVRYRTLKDFKPVSLVFSSAVFLMASNQGSQGDLKQVLATTGRAGDLSYGTHGAGTTGHYMGRRLERVSGVEMTHVPFTGDATILTALLGGHIKMGFLSGTGARKSLDSGRVRGLAVASAERSPLMPDVPTFKEQGFVGFDRESWGMLFAPAGTPDAVVNQIARDVDRIVKQNDVAQQFLGFGLGAKGGTPAEARRIVQDDFSYWSRLIEEFGALAQ